MTTYCLFTSMQSRGCINKFPLYEQTPYTLTVYALNSSLNLLFSYLRESLYCIFSLFLPALLASKFKLLLCVTCVGGCVNIPQWQTLADGLFTSHYLVLIKPYGTITRRHKIHNAEVKFYSILHSEDIPPSFTSKSVVLLVCREISWKSSYTHPRKQWLWSEQSVPVKVGQSMPAPPFSCQCSVYHRLWSVGFTAEDRNSPTWGWLVFLDVLVNPSDITGESLLYFCSFQNE